MFKLDLEKARSQRWNCQYLLDHNKRKWIPEEHLLLVHWLCYSLCGDHKKLWKILKELGIPDHLTCLLRNLSKPKATVRTGHETIDRFQIRKGVHQSCILSSCSFNLWRVLHVKCWAVWSTSLNQDFQEKYQYPQICRWHHPYGRKWRTKEPLDESEKEEWKCWLKS